MKTLAVGSLIVLATVASSEAADRNKEQKTTEVDGVWCEIRNFGTWDEEVDDDVLYVIRGKAFLNYDLKPAANPTWAKPGYRFSLIADTSPQQF
jgi:hypothetical protein